MRGPTNWYRTRAVNFAEETQLLVGGRPPRIAVPSMVISAAGDAALPPALAAGMEAHFEKLTKHVVQGGHWALWGESAEEVNGHIKEFLGPLLKAGGPKASI